MLSSRAAALWIRLRATWRRLGADWGRAVLALSLLTALELVILWRQRPTVPAANATSDAPSSFSAARVRALLEKLQLSRPHPTGTEAQVALRDRLLGELRAIGLDPVVERGPACGSFAVCASVENIIAVVPGRSETVEVALAAHYDSVPAGPGVGDDAQGVATLVEIARALSVEPPLNSVALVFSDGEELGLLGARLFVREHALADSVQTLLNVEARGTSGPSLMFETTDGSAWLVERYAHTVRRPVTSSLFAAVYKTLPNDTDLTVFSEHGMQGLNFAFVDGVKYYHTPLDRLDHLDFRSVQHQGESVLALARDLAARGNEPRGEDAVFFDVLGLFVVQIRQPVMVVLAALSVPGMGLGLYRRYRRRGNRGNTRADGVSGPGLLARALLSVFVGLSLLALLATGLGWVLRVLGALPTPWVDSKVPLLSALAALGVFSNALALLVCSKPPQRLALADAHSIAWLLIGCALTVVLPGASYLFVFPALVVVVTRAWFKASWAAELAVAFSTGVLWLPIMSLLYSVLGFYSLPVLAVCFALVSAPWCMLVHRCVASPRALGGLLFLAAMGAGVQALLPPYSRDSPQRLSLALAVDADGRARFLADASHGPLPEALSRVVSWSKLPADPHPWPSLFRSRVLEAPARVGRLPRPMLTVVHPNDATVLATIELTEDAWAANLHVSEEANIKDMRWRGQRVVPRVEGSFQTLTVVPGAERTVRVQLVFEGATPPKL